jgi:hypothetical protein
VLDAANPGQTLVTDAARDATDVSNVVDLGVYQFAELIEPVRLYALVDERAADAVRPPRARRLRLGTMPTDLPELLGRDDEIDAVVALLERSRLVTLTGVGGIGKTRLAVAIAERAGPELRDGVWLAGLETCTSRVDVATTVLSAVGIDGRRSTRRVVDALVAGLPAVPLDTAESAELVALLEDAGFVDVEVRDVPTGWDLADPSGLIELMDRLVALGDHGPEVQRQYADAVRRDVAAWQAAAGTTVAPNPTRLLTGRKSG